MRIVFGVFNNIRNAEEAVNELKPKGYIHDISVIEKNDGVIKSHTDKDMADEGLIKGFVAGITIGAAIGLFGGASRTALPGIESLFSTGMMALLWSAVGGVAGALAGGLIGAFVDSGVAVETVKIFENKIKAGKVLVAIVVDYFSIERVKRILLRHKAEKVAP